MPRTLATGPPQAMMAMGWSRELPDHQEYDLGHPWFAPRVGAWDDHLPLFSTLILTAYISFRYICAAIDRHKPELSDYGALNKRDSQLTFFVFFGRHRVKWGKQGTYGEKTCACQAFCVLLGRHRNKSEDNYSSKSSRISSTGSLVFRAMAHL